MQWSYGDSGRGQRGDKKSFFFSGTHYDQKEVFVSIVSICKIFQSRLMLVQLKADYYVGHVFYLLSVNATTYEMAAVNAQQRH